MLSGGLGMMGSAVCGRVALKSSGAQVGKPVQEIAGRRLAMSEGRTKEHIEDRNMVMQVLLVIVTLGIYAIYWYYVTLKELHIANRKDEGAGLYTVLLLIPLVSLIAYWHYASELSAFTDEKYPAILTFILWIIFAPVVWFLSQIELNKAAREAHSASFGSSSAGSDPAGETT